MANEVNNIVVSVHVAVESKLLHLIKVEEVIAQGQGTMAVALFGGQETVDVKLVGGQQKRKLNKGEIVYIRGERNGEAFTLNFPLTVNQAHEPWDFFGKSGTPGTPSPLE